MQKFNNIKEFISFKEKCVFCKTPLIPILTNFTGISKGIPIIKSKLIDNYFVFDIKHISYSITLKAKCHINSLTNEINFIIDYDNSYRYFVGRRYDHFMINDIIEVFENLRPYIELICNNKKCHMNYYSCSNVLSCERIDSLYINNILKIKPLLLLWECCNVDKFWVQNSCDSKVTQIYSTIDSNTKPIETPFIDFNLFDGDKLKNRIKTVLTFT